MFRCIFKFLHDYRDFWSSDLVNSVVEKLLAPNSKVLKDILRITVSWFFIAMNLANLSKFKICKMILTEDDVMVSKNVADLLVPCWALYIVNWEYCPMSSRKNSYVCCTYLLYLFGLELFEYNGHMYKWWDFTLSSKYTQYPFIYNLHTYFLPPFHAEKILGFPFATAAIAKQ